jgi:thioredoxin 1
MSDKAAAVSHENWDEQVIHSDQPVLVDFWAPWCGPCRMIAPTLDELAGEYAGRVKIVKLNVDDNQEISERYHVHAIPTLLLFRGGQVVEQQTGARPKAALAALLDAQLVAAPGPQPA